MRTIIILWFTIQTFISSSQIQHVADSTVSELYRFEQMYMQSNSRVEKNAIAFAKLQFMLRQNIIENEQTYKLAKLIDNNLLDSANRITNLWNTSLLFYYHEDYNTAEEALQSYKLQSLDSTLPIKILDLLIASKLNEDTLILKSTDTSLNSMCKCFYLEKMVMPKQSIPLIGYIIPGSHLLMKGYTGKAVASFCINAASIYLISKFIQSKMYINAAGFTVLVGIKFYQGSLVYSNKLIRKKTLHTYNAEIEKCHQQLEKLLMANPLNFK
jgi:hypothetical protein